MMSEFLAPGPETCWRITLALLHAGWIGVVLAILAAVAERLHRRGGPGWRYATNFAALLALGLSLPAALLIVGRAAPQGAAVATIRNPQPTAPAMPPLRAPHPGGGQKAAPQTITAPAGPVHTPAEPAAAPPGDDRSWRQALLSAAPYVTRAYGVGVLLMLARLSLAVGGGMQLRRAARAVDDGPLAAFVREHARRLGLAVVPVLGFCERTTVPMVLGVVRPMILLPAAMTMGLTPLELEVVLMHELAHVRRLDHAFLLLQRILEAVLFFHPAAWYLSRRIDREREHCCDDLVLAAGGDRVVYSRALLRVAELSLSRTNLPGAAPAARGRRPSDLRRRIARLLERSDEPAVKLTRLGVCAVVLFVVLAGGTTAALLSDDAKPDPAPRVAKDEPARKPAAPTKPAVSGRVLDASGKPIPFALVGVARENEYMPQLDLSQTLGGALADADGRFALTTFPPGDYDVVPVPAVEVPGAVALPDAARDFVIKRGSRPGTTRLEHALTETFAVRRVTIQAGARPVDVEIKAVPHVTYTARFVDSQGKAAPARPEAYPIHGELDGQFWQGIFRPVPGKPDTMIGLIPRALKDLTIQNSSDDTWWTWEPGAKRVSPRGIRVETIDGDRPGIVVQRFQSNVLEIRLRSTTGRLPETPDVHVSYPVRRGGDGGPIPTHVAKGVYRLSQMLLPGRDCQVVVMADGFKTASTRPFQFPGEGQTGIVEVTLTPGQRTNSWSPAEAQPVVLHTQGGQPIAQPVEVKGPDRAIACRAVDDRTGQPVTGAVVTFKVQEMVDEEGNNDGMDTLEDRQTQTDADGRFTVLVPEKYLPDPAPRRVLRTYVEIRHPGYVTYWGDVQLRALAAQGLSDAFPEFRAVRLVPARTVTGRLLDAEGHPFKKVNIYKRYPGSDFINLLDINKSKPIRDAEFPETDADGRFRMKIPIGMALKLEFRARASARKYHDVAASATDLGDIRLTPGVRLKGVVLDDAGKPVAGISVTTPAEPSENQPNFVRTTDKDGVFETDELPPGRYTARVGEFHQSEDGKDSPAPLRPAPGLYLPVPFVIVEGRTPPLLTVRPVPQVTFVATLTTTRPEPSKEEGKDVNLDTKQAQARLAEAIQFVVGFQVQGTFQGAAWTSTLNWWFDFSNDGKSCTVHVPKGLDNAQIVFAGYPERFRLRPGDPLLFGPAIGLGRVESGLPSIELRRYRETTLRLTFRTPGGNPPSELKVAAHYVREPGMRAAGVIFENAFPEPKRDGAEVRLSLLPDEQVELDVAGAAPLRVTLAEGETRNVIVDVPAP